MNSPARLRALQALLGGLLALVLALLPLGPLRPGLQAVPLRQGTPERPLPESSEALANRSPFSHSSYYPLGLKPDQQLYRPHADWMGRLILPSVEEKALRRGDWVWLDLEQAPPGQEALIGQRLGLTWADQPRLQAMVEAVSTDVRLGQAAREAAAAANVVPTRLDGRLAVGPLQSLAGARPQDSVSVRLEGVSLEGDTLRISKPPVQTSGRWLGLVTVLGPDSASDDPHRWRVRHYDRSGRDFSGVEESIRIPRLPPDRFGRVMLDPSGLVASELNPKGWLISGAPGPDGVFTVQALQPRALLGLSPTRVVRGTSSGLRQINRENWAEAALRRGTLTSTALTSEPDELPLASPGQRALLIHLFGGIGGRDGEPSPAWTTTGHLALGEAEVVVDPFSGEPQLDLRYHQIYANNPNGIVAGSQDWSAYAGNLQRGWLGTRPFSDVLVPLDGPLLDALALQAEIISARYRTGDGQGVALVTPATSCVQDSSQALWIALDQLRAEQRLAGVAPDPDSRLSRLGRGLEELLTPFGMVRPDWRHNARVTAMAGTGLRQDSAGGAAQPAFMTSQGPVAVLLSLRSMLPRRAHDGLATVFLRQGLPLWILRTNQIPGNNPALEPVAPTTLLGHLPVVGTLVPRLMDGLVPPLLGAPLGFSVLVLLLYGALALGLGFGSGFLHGPWRWGRPGGGGWPGLLRRAAALLVLPALVEELIFRGLLLPHPLEGVPAAAMAAWGALSVGLFVAYHPLAGRLWYPQGRAVSDDPRFLLQCTLLGGACVLVYSLTGSLWSAVGLHWLAVLVWLEALGGHQRLEPDSLG